MAKSKTPKPAKSHPDKPAGGKGGVELTESDLDRARGGATLKWGDIELKRGIDQ
jgi:hypothetical protein